MAVPATLPSSTSYRPEMKAEYWSRIEAFVTEVVADVDGRTPYEPKTIYGAMSRLALWAWQSAGLPLDRDVLLRRETINRFINEGCQDQQAAGRSNVRAQLLRVAEATLSPRLAPVRLSPLRGADPSEPYSLTEITQLRSWALRQSTPARRSNAGVLLALGAGAGLSAGEIGNLRVRDIVADELGVVVRVQEKRPRSVPVLDSWARSLRERREELPLDSFAFRPSHTVNYPNLVSNFVDRSKVAEVRPQTQRLRATWLVNHLTAGTSVISLMAAAGVESLEALTRYLAFAESGSAEEARVRLHMLSI
jgi:integrase